MVRRADRRLMMKLSGGTAGFQIETGRWGQGQGIISRRLFSQAPSKWGGGGGQTGECV